MTPTVLSYLEERMGRSTGFGMERHFNCAFCLDRVGTESSKRKLDVNLTVGLANCYRCGYKANLLQLFRDLSPNGRLSMDALRLLRNTVKLDPGVSLSTAVRQALKGGAIDTVLIEKRPVGLPPEYIPISDDPTRFAVAPAVRYLNQRGIPPEAWSRFNIGYAREGRYAGYLIFPVMQGGECRYFTTRQAGNTSDRKTLNPLADEQGRNVTKEDVLFGYDLCIGAPVVALTEGPVSCMAFPYAVAAMGKSYSIAQVRLLEALVHYGTKEFVVALDSDALEYSCALAHRLRSSAPTVTQLVFPTGDPWDNRANLAEFMASRRTQVSLLDRVRSRVGAR